MMIREKFPFEGGCALQNTVAARLKGETLGQGLDEC